MTIRRSLATEYVSSEAQLIIENKILSVLANHTHANREYPNIFKIMEYAKLVAGGVL